MLLLKQQLRHLHISLAEAASATGVSKPAIVDLINHGRWPRRNPEQLRKRITELLASHNVDTTHSFDEVRPQATAITQVQQTTEDSMLLKKQTLSQKAKKAFKLFTKRRCVDGLSGKPKSTVCGGWNLTRPAWRSKGSRTGRNGN